MRRLEQALYMDRNTIPNINTTSFAFEQNIKYNTRLDILQFPTFIVTTSLGPSQLTTGATIIPNKPRHLPNFIEKT
jgi:hypothetical protein